MQREKINMPDIVEGQRAIQKAAHNAVIKAEFSMNQNVNMMIKNKHFDNLAIMHQQQSLVKKAYSSLSSQRQKNDPKQINQSLKKYPSLSDKQRQQCRKKVMDYVYGQLNKFDKLINESNANLEKLNLIVGATGSGKSTLFNYLNGVPLMVVQKFQKGLHGEDISDGQPILIIDDSKLKTPQQRQKQAKIGSRYSSETTIPNFYWSEKDDITYVDCAGQFDNNNLLQSIVNSYFKYQLANRAKQVKITIAFSYNSLVTDRASAFKQVLKEVGNFIGMWDSFIKHRSISLVVTSVPAKNDRREVILGKLRGFILQVQDLGIFKEILENILERQAVAVFLKPKQVVLNREQGNGDQPQMGYKFNVPYQTQHKIKGNLISSPQLIKQILSTKTKFVKNQKSLFVQNLQKDAQDIVNFICQDMIKDIKRDFFNISVFAIIQKSNKQESPSLYLKNIGQKLKQRQKFQMHSFMEQIDVEQKEIKKFWKQIKLFKKFQKISNITNFKQRLNQAAKQIELYVYKEITTFLLTENLQKEKIVERMKQQMEKKIIVQQEDLDYQKWSQNQIKSEEDWISKLTVKNISKKLIKTIFIKHGSNRSSKSNQQFKKPQIKKIQNLAIGHQSKFMLKFNNDWPNRLWNAAKLVLTLGIKTGWGKDYWEIQVVFDEQNRKTTTGLTYWFVDVEQKDQDILILISDKQVEIKMDSGSDSAQLSRIKSSKQIKQDGWS